LKRDSPLKQADPYSPAQILYNETEKLLDKWKHPDPYKPPTAPGGMVPPSESLYSTLTDIHYRLEV
jgi:hypothetical protein